MELKCKKCNHDCKKSGKQSSGIQKYRCKLCGLYQQRSYTYQAYTSIVHDQFSRMNKLGCGIRKMAVFLKISINTLQNWLGKALTLKADTNIEENKVYDIDEIQTYLTKRANKIWVTYAWDLQKRKAISLFVGGRSTENLREVVDEVLLRSPRKINTDKHPTYGCF